MLFISTELYSQELLPEFVATDLNGRIVDFPSDLNGKKSLVAFAFSPKSREQLSTWVEPVYGEFIDKESLASMVYDVHVFLVIVFNKVNDSFRPKVERELKENVLNDFFGNIVLAEDASRYLKESLKISNDDEISLFTIDTGGRVTSESRGLYTEKKLDELSSFLEMD